MIGLDKLIIIVSYQCMSSALTGQYWSSCQILLKPRERRYFFYYIVYQHILSAVIWIDINLS